MALNFSFLRSKSMSHTDDVINWSIKKATQIWQKHNFSKSVDFFQIPVIGSLFLCEGGAWCHIIGEKNVSTRSLNPHDFGVRLRKNLLIASGTMIFLFTVITIVLYIIWKHVIHWFQICIFYKDRINLVRYMVILLCEWSKWPFLMTKLEYGRVKHHFEANQVLITK